jgi:spore coat polysaccharide biosynthesis protein SpsF
MAARGRVVASIEARMGSSRLPGKMLKDVFGKPALSRLLDRLRQCKLLDDIVVATTTAPADDALEQWAKREKVSFFRGSEEDVLQRVVRAQEMMNTDIVVEITGDCILVDPAIIDMGVETYFANDCDIVSTDGSLPNWPLGQCVQVFSLAALQWVEKMVTDVAVREHVSLYFYEHPERYRLVQMIAPRRWQGPEIRTQLDYPEDIVFINAVYGRLETIHGSCFGIEPLMNLLREEPSLLSINAHCQEKMAR